jgi:type II secretory pathway predicted ATPase ExeA
MIQFRLAVAGRAEPLFTDRAMQALFDFSKGIPRPLIVVCNETMHMLVETGRFEADEAEVMKAIEVYNQRPRSEPNGE